MTLSKWQDILDKIQQKFPDATYSTDEIDDDSGGKREIVEFSGPIGNVRLEFVTKPKFLGEDTIYSNRIGSDVTVTKRYDENETVSYMKAYVEKDGEWEEVSAEAFV